MANECIPLFRPGQDFTAVTTGAVTGSTCVALSAARNATSGLIGVATAGAGLAIAGVAVTDAASGARVAVTRGRGMVVPITAGAGVTALSEVEVGTGGKVINKASGIAIGVAWEAGTNNNPVMIQLY